MEIGTVRQVKIEDEVRDSYLDYAMSVIVSRALPDVRDGLKPVHRRILYAMNELGLRHTSPYKKCARIVGEVLGKYHPHGDASVYEALVRLAQDFSMRYPLVQGQGNFGSMDNDPAAAMRYTEARLAAIAQEMLADIDKETVDFAPNFDDTLKEPLVLPARLPNLLVNGSSGIAVGMATNIPPHNLSEVCRAVAHLVDNPEATIDDLVTLIPAPDFPTGGIIIGREDIRKVYTTGQGRIVVRAKAEIEELSKGRRQILITELPYQTNKAELVERIARLVREKRLEGISELRDESDRHGLRIVIELRKDTHPQQLLNNLYKHTALQSTFYVNMIALVDGQPRLLNIKDALQHYIDFRHQVIVRRSQFDLRQAKERAHILEGLKVALDNLDQVVAVIRQSRTTEMARNELMAQLGLTQTQAQAILDLQLRRLVALERQKIIEEYADTLRTIAYLEDLLANPRKILYLVKQEAEELSSRYGDARRTQLSTEETGEFSDTDLIPHQEMIVTVSSRGYAKRVPSSTYKVQHRGGRGVRAMVTKETESVSIFLTADTHDTLLFFTSKGRVLPLKCYRIPQDTARTAKGTPLVNLLPLGPDEQISTAVTAKFEPGNFLLLATAKGKVKRTPAETFSNLKSRGLIAISLTKDDELVAARLAKEEDQIILVTENGKAIRFPVSNLRPISRTSQGVRGIRLGPGDKVVSMEVVCPATYMLTVTSKGYGKLTSIDAYPAHQRGGKGVIAHRVSDKVGKVVTARMTTPTGELLLISEKGVIIRVSKESIPIHGRSTRGVSLMRVDPGHEVTSIDFPVEDKLSEETPRQTRGL